MLFLVDYSSTYIYLIFKHWVIFYTFDIIIWVRILLMTRYTQSVYITTKVVGSNLVVGEVYLIQHYVIKFVSDLLQVGGFLPVLRFPPPINWPTRYNWNIVESGIKHNKPNQSN